ncbi:hypothetical protein BDV11DRAFT_143116 [Aspergillus similis]
MKRWADRPRYRPKARQISAERLDGAELYWVSLTRVWCQAPDAKVQFNTSGAHLFLRTVQVHPRSLRLEMSNNSGCRGAPGHSLRTNPFSNWGSGPWLRETLREMGLESGVFVRPWTLVVVPSPPFLGSVGIWLSPEATVRPSWLNLNSSVKCRWKGLRAPRDLALWPPAVFRIVCMQAFATRCESAIRCEP